MQTTIDDIIRIADDLHLESASQDLAYLKNAPNTGILSKSPMSSIWLRLLTFTILQKHQNGGCIQTRQVRLFGKLTEKVYRKIGEKMEKENSVW